MANGSGMGVRRRKVLLAVVEKFLPHGVRVEYMYRLEEQCFASGHWLSESAATIAAGYRNQIVLAFNAVAVVLQIAAVWYCFSAVPLLFALGLIEGATVTALILRSAFVYSGDRYGNQQSPAARLQYALNSFVDAVVAMVVVLLSESLTMVFSPGLAAQPGALLNGVVVALPILSTLQVMFRPKIQWKLPFQGPNLTPRKILWKTWWLNVLWISTLMGTIIIHPDFLPDWVPEHDFLRSFIPMHIFITWFRLQQNPFIRRDKVETLTENWKKKQKARRRELLIKGLNRGEPFYRTYVVLQGVLFLYLSIPLARSLWPWLAGHPADVDLFRVAVNVVTLMTLTWAWNYVKDANRVCSDALQQDVDDTDWDTPVYVWWGLRCWRWVWAPARRRLPFVNRNPRIPRSHGITGSHEMYRVGIITIVDHLRC